MGSYISFLYYMRIFYLCRYMLPTEKFFLNKNKQKMSVVVLYSAYKRIYRYEGLKRNIQNQKQ